MSKVLSVENGNYIVKVESGKNIILDTSRGEVDSNQDLVGEVIINGGLLVKGTTTTVNSQNLNVYDNIIVVNKYKEDDPGYVPPNGIVDASGKAGIEIDRGAYGRSRIVWDESIAWSTDVQSTRGTFTFEDDDFELPVPIYVGGIKVPGKFYIEAPSPITTEKIADYKYKVLYYNNDQLFEVAGTPIVDDQFVPNLAAMADYVEYAVTNISTGAVISSYDSKVQVIDTNDANPSHVDFFIDNTVEFSVYENKIQTLGLVLENNIIKPLNENTDLILQAPGQSSIKIDDVLTLTKTPHLADAKIDPEAPLDGIKLYSKTNSSGGTGLFFINENEINDEMISKTKALVYSLIF